MLEWLKRRFSKKIYSILEKKFLNRQSLTELLDRIDWNKELSPLLDEQLAKLVDNFKQKNPMTGMFLTPGMTAPLVESAKQEILNQIPELKQKLIDKVTSPEGQQFIQTELTKRF